MSELILLCRVEEAAEAARCGLRIALAAYAVGQDGRLYSRRLPEGLTAAALLLGGRLPGSSPVLAREISAECMRRGCEAIICCDAAARLAPLLKVPVYSFAPESGCGAVISTAISGGNLHGLFLDALAAFGRSGVIALVEPVRRRFDLPSADGEGRDMSGAELFEFSQSAVSSGFSPELCCRYLLAEDGAALYDNADTLGKKLEVLELLGVERVLLPYCELFELLGSDGLNSFLRKYRKL